MAFPTIGTSILPVSLEKPYIRIHALHLAARPVLYLPCSSLGAVFPHQCINNEPEAAFGFMKSAPECPSPIYIVKVP